MVLIDARMLGPEMSGIGRYTLNLLSAIDQVKPDRPVAVWVSPGADLPEAVRRSVHLDLRPMAGDPRKISDQWASRRRLHHSGAKLLHCPDVFAPLSPTAGVRTLVTLHDVIPLVCKGQLHRSRKQQFLPLWRAWLMMQTRRASAVVTVSEHSAGDLHRVLGVPRSKLHVIHNAVPEPAPSPDEATGETLLHQLGIRPPFVLNVGRRDPYKNVEGLVRAFAVLRQRGEETLQLVLVGASDPRYPEAERLAGALGVADAVRFTGWIPDAALAALYRRAAALIMPSFYEGFGLPAVEAMRAGTPVLAADNSSIPEVVGDAAILFDPSQPEAMAAAITRVLSDPALARQLVERGHHRAERFSLIRFGAAHLRLYKAISARGRDKSRR